MLHESTPVFILLLSDWKAIDPYLNSMWIELLVDTFPLCSCAVVKKDLPREEPDMFSLSLTGLAISSTTISLNSSSLLE